MKLQQINVVVVEDEFNVRKELIDGLEEDPMIKVCGEAEGVKDAFEQIIATKPDAIFLDIKLIHYRTHLIPRKFGKVL